MDELYAFLFAGLFIMLMLFIFFGGGIEVKHHPITQENLSENSHNEEGNLTWKTIELGTIQAKKEIIEDRINLEKSLSVSNGIFFGNQEYSKKFKVIPENLNKSTMHFNIDDTNNYGRLIISLNNHTIFNNKAIRGEYDLDIQNEKENYIYIKTTSSGWKIWAPSIYKISNLSVNLQYNILKNPEYNFDVPYYIYKNFYKGVLKFDYINSTQNFSIILNNNTVYNGTPTHKSNTIEFSRYDIFPKENKIEVVSEGDYRLERTEILLYYVS
ncbi:MAG: hypothetical protein B6U88_01565 [Candidatus Aenigmarchaeota archaeon ex4484_56]|nr:MAG: hypothetical protein B6U88_01565 [Candidatus Aenigmarchaeota archaeon ex4484_56]